MIRERQSWLVWFLLRSPFFLLAVTMVVPYYFMITKAFKTVPELLTFPPTLYIKKPTLNNFYNPTPLEPYHTNGLFQYFDRAPLRFGNIIFLFILASIPIMLMFLVFQKQFVENIAMTGIKG